MHCLLFFPAILKNRIYFYICDKNSLCYITCVQVISVSTSPDLQKQVRPYSTAATCLQCAEGPCPAPHSHCPSNTTPFMSRQMSTLYEADFFISAQTTARTKVLPLSCLLVTRRDFTYLENQDDKHYITVQENMKYK